MGRIALLLALSAQLGVAATYFVDGSAENASDENPGSEAEPWKTIARAGSAEELKPGDTVLIKTGVYREHAKIRVSGEPGKPITFAAAPGAKVVVKGSEIVDGTWTRVTDDPTEKEPFPNAYTGVWKIQLGDEYFTDADFPNSYKDPAKRWVSQVIIQDRKALQLIGRDWIYRDKGYPRLRMVGQDLSDIHDDSFYFDAATQTLYIRISGEPSWFAIEVGVRGWVLTVRDAHDVVVRGLEVRQNRQPGGQWPMASVGGSERVTVENCRFSQADFCGFSVGSSKHCVVRGCDMSGNGNTGFGMSKAEDCLVENCTLMFNNYRRFRSGWHAGGMKCIPANKRCTVRNCEVAYNIASDGIWFDADNEDILIEGNVSHHNDGCGVFFEINKGGGVIANNLVYANRGRGIYVSGSQKTWVVNNTVVANDGGVVAMPRGPKWPLEDIHVLNNLLVANYIAAATVTRGTDLTLFMDCEQENGPVYQRRNTTNHSDGNIFANTSWTPFLRHTWNPNNTLPQWRQRWGEDLHSREMPIEYELKGTSFRLLTTDGLAGAAALPKSLRWQPATPGRVGCQRTCWPGQ
jgi:parallel beta-helix repeat protein